MKSKKVAAILTIILFSFSVCACGSSVEQEERMTESTTEESESSSTEEIETSKETETKKETETSKETQKETETTKETKDNKTESTTETKSNESKANKDSETTKASTPKEDTKPAETTAPRATEAPKPTHTHNYTAVVTAQPTCTTQGTKSYSCSCGDSYTESIPCTDHVWQDRYETIHHEAEGEMRQVQVGTSGDVYICNTCGAEFGSSSGMMDHRADLASSDPGHARATYTIRDGGPLYENQYTIIKEAYDEQILVGQTCVNCGFTR